MVKQSSECLLDSHDLLVNVIIKMTSAMGEGAGSLMGVNGVLKRDLDYVLTLDKFRDEYETIFGPHSHFHPPDGFLTNPEKSTTITVECKSGIDEDETNLKEQLFFYSSNPRFKEIFLDPYEKTEILIVCTEDCLTDACAIIEDYGTTTNCVVWAVKKKSQSDEFSVQKRFGKHIDADLNKMMGEGKDVLPPSNVFLVSPHISPPRLAAEIIKRLLSSFVGSLEPELKIKQFIEKQTDSVISYKRMRDTIRYVFTLVPELGELNEDKTIINFKNLRNFEKIQRKRRRICNLSKYEFEQELRNASQKKRRKRKLKEADKAQTKIPMFLN